VAALHPVNSEAVAWISGRSELLLTLFFLGALLLHLRARQARTRHTRLVWAAAAGLLHLAALLVKESAIIFPLLLAALELLLPLGKGSAAPQPTAGDGSAAARGLAASGRRGLLLAGFQLLATGVYLLLRVHALSGPKAGLELLDPLWLLLAPAEIALTYLRWFCLPIDLTLIRSFSPSLQGGLLATGSLGLLLGLLLGVLVRRRRRGLEQGRLPLAALGVFWFVLGIAPTVLFTLLSGGMAERYLYLPGLGLVLLVALGLEEVLHRGLRPALLALLFGLLLAGLTGATFVRAGQWRDDVTIHVAALAQDPDRPEPLYRLGTVLLLEAEPEQALAFLARAHALAPTSPRYASNLGWLLRRQGRQHEARAVLERPLQAGAADPGLLCNLALVEFELAVQQGDPALLASARSHLQRALTLDPRHGPSLQALEEVEQLAPLVGGEEQGGGGQAPGGGGE
jgi:tetratricopeptide (TPR) repeat protein